MVYVVYINGCGSNAAEVISSLMTMYILSMALFAYAANAIYSGSAAATTIEQWWLPVPSCRMSSIRAQCVG
jgi:hypothetical protein